MVLLALALRRPLPGSRLYVLGREGARRLVDLHRTAQLSPFQSNAAVDKLGGVAGGVLGNGAESGGKVQHVGVAVLEALLQLPFNAFAWLTEEQAR